MTTQTLEVFTLRRDATGPTAPNWYFSHGQLTIHTMPTTTFLGSPSGQSAKLFSSKCRVCVLCVCTCMLSHLVVSKLCPTLYDPMDCSPPGSSVHGIFLARILDWVAISSSRCSWPRDGTRVSCVSCIGRWILYHWTTWKAHRKKLLKVM